MVWIQHAEARTTTAKCWKQFTDCEALFDEEVTLFDVHERYYIYLNKICLGKKIQ
jgi:hypothetical protein